MANNLIKNYGEINTNTNHLSELIRLNLDVLELLGTVPTEIKRYQDKWVGNEWLRGLYFLIVYSRNLGWKHPVVDWGRIRESSVYRSNTVTVVTLTKKPCSWLLSLYKNTYHQCYKANPAFEKIIKMPWQAVWSESLPRVIQSPVHLWNFKHHSYIRDADKSRVLNIRTEDTLLNPLAVIERIAEETERALGVFSNVVKSTKKVGMIFYVVRIITWVRSGVPKLVLSLFV